MGGRVLIVEDEPTIAEPLSFVLDHAGYAVAVEQDGAQALRRITMEDTDLVILDVMLPNKSGFDILAELRQGEYADMPVLMLTAKGQSKDRETATALGATVFMTKPFSNRDVVKTVHDLIRRKGQPDG